jgi:hypothetical protein
MGRAITFDAYHLPVGKSDSLVIPNIMSTIKNEVNYNENVDEINVNIRVYTTLKDLSEYERFNIANKFESFLSSETAYLEISKKSSLKKLATVVISEGILAPLAPMSRSMLFYTPLAPFYSIIAAVSELIFWGGIIFFPVAVFYGAKTIAKIKKYDDLYKKSKYVLEKLKSINFSVIKDENISELHSTFLELAENQDQYTIYEELCKKFEKNEEKSEFKDVAKNFYSSKTRENVYKNNLSPMLKVFKLGIWRKLKDALFQPFYVGNEIVIPIRGVLSYE